MEDIVGCEMSVFLKDFFIGLFFLLEFGEIFWGDINYIYLGNIIYCVGLWIDVDMGMCVRLDCGDFVGLI